MTGPKSIISTLQRHGALWPLVALGLIWLVIIIEDILYINTRILNYIFCRK